MNLKQLFTVGIMLHANAGIVWGFAIILEEKVTNRQN
jgi:hypothetical protein